MIEELAPHDELSVQFFKNDKTFYQAKNFLVLGRSQMTERKARMKRGET